MGICSSSCCSIKTPEYIIGLTGNLPPEEQRLFSLAKYVFTRDEMAINDASQIHGPDILGLIYDQSLSEKQKSQLCENEGHMISPRRSISDQKLVEITQRSGEENALTDRRSSESKDGPISEHAVLIESKHAAGVSKLFHLLVTNKPIWFSQSFTIWKRDHSYETCFSCCQSVKQTIYIQPIDSFPAFIKDFQLKLNTFEEDFSFLRLLKTFAEAFFDGMHVKILPNVDIQNSEWKITSRIHEKTGQKQYLVTDFYRELKKILPQDGYCIMGISWTDLYPTEKLNFVLGEANNSLKSGVFCFGRFEPKTYQPDCHLDITRIDGELLWRLLKVFSHELCHLFGLQHCWYFACAMNESSSMAEAFSQPLFLCPVCLRKLQYVCCFDITRRYQKLHSILNDISTVFPTSDFKNAVKWLEQCIEFLQRDERL